MGLWQHMILIKWFGIISLADFFFVSYFIMLQDLFMYYLFICIYARVICLFLNHNNIFMICSNKFVQVASKVQAGGQISKEGMPFEESSS